MTTFPNRINRPLERLGLPDGSRWFGIFVGVVTHVVDPDGQGRVRVELPWARDEDGSPYTGWCRLVTPMAGPSRGVWFVPDTGDEVAVMFEGGDPRRPYVMGGLWNGVDEPPEAMDAAGDNDIRAIHSKSGIRIVMDDTPSAVAFTVDTPGGQRIELEDDPATLRLRDANGNSVELAPGGITIQCSAKLSITASSIEVSAGSVTTNSGMSKFSGVVDANTVITPSVVGSSYTPGAGNIW